MKTAKNGATYPCTCTTGFARWWIEDGEVEGYEEEVQCWNCWAAKAWPQKLALLYPAPAREEEEAAPLEGSRGREEGQAVPPPPATTANRYPGGDTPLASNRANKAAPAVEEPSAPHKALPSPPRKATKLPARSPFSYFCPRLSHHAPP